MKTSEMIAMLEENPKLRFKVTPYSETNVRFDNVRLVDGILCWEGNPGYPLRIVIGGYHRNWQLFPQPVTWQEALQAVLDGKTVTCECNICVSGPDKCIYESKCDICTEGIKSGTWYIKGDADA